MTYQCKRLLIVPQYLVLLFYDSTTFSCVYSFPARPDFCRLPIGYVWLYEQILGYIMHVISGLCFIFFLPTGWSQDVMARVN